METRHNRARQILETVPRTTALHHYHYGMAWVECIIRSLASARCRLRSGDQADMALLARPCRFRTQQPREVFLDLASIRRTFHDRLGTLGEARVSYARIHVE